MIVYELTARVGTEQIEKFIKFMRETHMPDLLRTGHFTGAEIARFSESGFRIRYLAKDLRTLENYLETDAAGLRKDFVRHFPDGIEVTREILDVIAVF